MSCSNTESKAVTTPLTCSQCRLHMTASDDTLKPMFGRDPIAFHCQQFECTNEHGEVGSGIGELVQDERKNGREDEDVQTTPQTVRTTLVRCCMQSDR